MSDTPVYQATLLRPREVWRDFELTCNGITVSYRPGWENGLAILCQALRNAGLPDGSMKIAELARSGLRQELESIYHISELPTTYERAKAEAGNLGERPRPPAPTTPSAASSPAEGSVEGSIARSPDAPLARAGGGIDLSAESRAALSRLRDDEGAWASLQGRLRGVFVARGLAEVIEPKLRARVTPKGYASLGGADGATPADTSEAPVERDDAPGPDQATRRALDEPQPETPVLEKVQQSASGDNIEAAPLRELAMADEGERENVQSPPVQTESAPASTTAASAPGNISPRQREAFEIVRRAPEKWLDIHGRTRNYMVDTGWVQVSKSGQPRLTREGARVAKSEGLI